jgi:hypothetical protein
MAVTNTFTDREEAKREDNFDFVGDYDEEEDDEEWEQEAAWDVEADEGDDVKDESAAYLEFLNEEVRLIPLQSLHFLTFKGSEVRLCRR